MRRFTGSTSLVAVGVAAVGLTVAGCSSHSSSAAAASSAPAAPSGTGARQKVAACFRDHGADPLLLAGLLTSGSADLSSSQLSALRAAGIACASSVPASLDASLAKIATCLNGKGYHLDAGSPPAALLSLKLNSAATDSAIRACVPGTAAAPASAS